MSGKAVVLVTRRLPEAVEGRLARDYEARFNKKDTLYSDDELVAWPRAPRPLSPAIPKN